LPQCRVGANLADRIETCIGEFECILRWVAGDQAGFIAAQELLGKNHQSGTAIGGKTGQFDRLHDVCRHVSANRLRLRGCNLQG
jgi:hypothetical protein